MSLPLAVALAVAAIASVVIAGAWLYRACREDDAEQELAKLWRKVSTRARRREDLDETHFNALAARKSDDQN